MIFENFYWHDALRFILLAQITYAILNAVLILHYYLKRKRENRGMRGNLTKHVVGMLTVFIALSLYAFFDVATRIGNGGLTWRTPALIPVFLLAIVDEWLMFNIQVRKFKRGE